MPTPSETTRVIEDYLPLIWKACAWPGEERRATTSDLAASLGVTPSTVSANLKKLARQELIRYEPYGAIELTAEGERIAVEVVRRHRIIETYLVEQLQLTWDQVHDEADRLEHAVSDLVLARMDEAIGFPDIDPHGDPIPRPGRRISEPRARALAEAAEGETVCVSRVSDRNAEVLQFLTARSIAIGAQLRVERPLAVTGLMTVRHAGRPVELSALVAQSVLVVPAASR